MEDKKDRKLRRMRAIKGAKVWTDRSAGLGIDCRIVDIHSRGARLRFTHPVPLADRVVVLIYPENVSAHATTRWQDGTDAGIEFDEPLAWLERHDRMLKAS